MNATYATIARLSSSLTPDTAEQWCASHEVSVAEAVRIWTAANGNPTAAERVWSDETGWRRISSR